MLQISTFNRYVKGSCETNAALEFSVKDLQMSQNHCWLRWINLPCCMSCYPFFLEMQSCQVVKDQDPGYAMTLLLLFPLCSSVVRVASFICTSC
ncbi:hypothetical protein L1987_83338 [Smallanthus sonchifolius]|uniref:Uncharacterized protein n=1 Tax=Smallanthus sonchifolius TaxID=185202 RepID=A0ACB8YCL1_9ASTR|nr:hypothetical protein L1987_83338 [Smallanthus sonchifolius]